MVTGRGAGTTGADARGSAYRPDATVHENDHRLVGEDRELTVRKMEGTARPEEEQRGRIEHGGSRSEAGKKWTVRSIPDIPE